MDTSALQSPPPPLSAEAIPLFKEGISLVLNGWTALQMAVVNEWGGRNSRQVPNQLSLSIFSWFTQSKEQLFIDDLELILEEAMDSLNTTADDGSIEEVADKLVNMYEECLEGNYGSIVKLRNAPQTGSVSRSQEVVDDDGDNQDNYNNENSFENNGSEDMMVDTPNSTEMQIEEKQPNEMAEEEDGWVKVGPLRNQGRKN
ncbi:Pre-rRNA-processing protein TSR2 [Dillenia turbinata]|uniref:Pre-rRNA-processing protein TSR2 n=1 Tax=Dillenia turbinata TaxID=194707 RepID=A0AAN8UPC1_9MAGN